MLQTVDMIVDFRRLFLCCSSLLFQQSCVNCKDLKIPENYHLQDLNYVSNINSILKKAHRLMYFLKQEQIAEKSAK